MTLTHRIRISNGRVLVCATSLPEHLLRFVPRWPEPPELSESLERIARRMSRETEEP